jgi:hypothetical protein
MFYLGMRFPRWCFIRESVLLILFASHSGITFAESSGFLEGHLTIVSLKEVELAGSRPSKPVLSNYAEFPLVILRQSDRKQMIGFNADKDGNYRVELTPGDYILDFQGRASKRLRAKPQRFTIGSNETVRVDMTVDTGIR